MLDIEFPPLRGTDAEVWPVLFDLAQTFRRGWAVVGAQMVYSNLHVHDSCRGVYARSMAPTRLNITLDEASAQRLSVMARRMHVNEGTLARSLLTTALDEADLGATNIVALLDGIPGAWEDAQEGWRQAEEGETIPLDQL
ncbi:MAG: hypothetical protein WD250_07275 [Egibacteraceae bacterium]